MPADQHLILAFWRQSTCYGVEIFIPSVGYSTMRYDVVEDPAIAARRITKSRFDIEPRGNARIFRRPDDCVVAFGVTSAEAAALDEHGDWMPPVLVMDVDVDIAPMLHELVMRL